MTRLLVEQAHQLHGLLVIHGRDQVGVAHIVNPRNMLVADAFDAVLAESELQQGGTLQGLGRHHPDAGMLRAQVVAGGNRSGGTGGADIGRQAAPVGYSGSRRSPR